MRPARSLFLYIGRSIRAVADVQHNIDLVEAADIYVNKALVGSDGLLVRAVKNVVEQNGEVAVRKKRKSILRTSQLNFTSNLRTGARIC